VYLSAIDLTAAASPFPEEPKAMSEGPASAARVYRSGRPGGRRGLKAHLRYRLFAKTRDLIP
jgi:hypothetical protein